MNTHTFICFPCDQSYWSDKDFTPEEFAAAIDLLKRNASPPLTGMEMRFVTEPGQFTGVKFDESKMVFTPDLTEEDKAWLKKDFEKDALAYYQLLREDLEEFIKRYRSGGLA